MKIAILSKSFSSNNVLLKELIKAFPSANIILQKSPSTLNIEETINFLAGCEKAIIGLEDINENVLSRLPELKHISKFGVGLDNIDLVACQKYGVKVTWTEGVNKLSVAEMTLGFMLGLSRNLYQSAFHLKEGNWIKDGGYQLSKKTIGIIGVGNIGKEVIRLLKPFECELLVNDIRQQDIYYKKVNAKSVTKEEILERADIITVHTPFTSETKDLFSLESFKKCRRKPYIINTARGGIINEKDLINALNSELISGAAIDVFISEPLNIKEIFSHKKIVCTPHIGGNASEAVKAMGMSAIENLL